MLGPITTKLNCASVLLFYCVASVYSWSKVSGLPVYTHLCWHVCMSPTKLELLRTDGLRSNFAQLWSMRLRLRLRLILFNIIMANNNNTKYLLIRTLKIIAMLLFQYTEVTKNINTTDLWKYWVCTTILKYMWCWKNNRKYIIMKNK